MDDFPYQSAQAQLLPGDTLALITDGVTEAQDTQNALFGGARYDAILHDYAPQAGVGALVQAVQDGVAQFAAGREPADDLTMLALVWQPLRAQEKAG
jgi:serine phosphatase RsbU (regulator of sigma subunit)